MKKKICALLAFIFIVSLVLPSCEKVSDKAVVMNIDGMEVRADLYNYVYGNYSDENKDENEEKLREKTENSLVTIYSALSLAKDYDVSIDDTYFTDLANYTVESSKQEEGFSKNLEDHHMTEWVFRFLTKQNALKDMVYASMQDCGEIATSKNGLFDVVMGDDFIAVKQILIVGERHAEDSFIPAKTHTDEEAKALAEEILKKIENGEDFDALVKEYGESLYMMQQPEGYYICRGMWNEENEEAAFSLDIGETSGVVESEAGFSIFMRCEKDEKTAKTLLKDIEENYGNAIYTTKIENRIEEIKEKIEYTDDYNRIILKDKK